MQLQPVSNFFNFSDKPWTPIADPRYGEWTPPGLAYNSSVQHVHYVSRTNPFERPAQLILWTCASVNDGDMDILLYAGDMNLPWKDYPWKDGNMVELAILRIENTQGHVVNRGVSVKGPAIDALMAMAAKTDQMRFGVACRYPDGGKILWHSAQMCSSYY